MCQTKFDDLTLVNRIGKIEETMKKEGVELRKLLI